MDGGLSCDEGYYSSDRESLDGLENEESGPNWGSSKGPSTRVIWDSCGISFLLLLDGESRLDFSVPFNVGAVSLCFSQVMELSIVSFHSYISILVIMMRAWAPVFMR